MLAGHVQCFGQLLGNQLEVVHQGINVRKNIGIDPLQNILMDMVMCR